MDIFERLLMNENPSLYFRNNRKEIYELIPEFKACDGFDQCNDYHIYDVLEHTLCVLDNVGNDYVLRVAALFHDIGKPVCFTKDEDGVGHFYNHWVESRRIFNKYIDLLNISKNEVELISSLIYYHDLRPLDKHMDEFKRVFDDKLILLIKLKIADVKAQNSKYYDRLIELKEIEASLTK